MSSSNAYRRRQSMRSPQRKRQDPLSRWEEETFDPFVKTTLTASKIGQDGVYKQVLADMHARANQMPTLAPTDSLPCSSMSRSASGTVRYEDRHDRLFKSMKSIASPGRNTRREKVLPRSELAQRSHQTSTGSSAIGANPGKSLAKRIPQAELEGATPSKRRRMEPVVQQKSLIPALAFNFASSGEKSDLPRSTEYKVPAAKVTSTSKLPSRVSNRDDASQGTLSNHDVLEPPTKSSSTMGAAVAAAAQVTDDSMDSTLARLRERKRAEERQKVILQRRNKKGGGGGGQTTRASWR